MKAEHINPFVAALTRSLKTMADCDARRTGLRLREGNGAPHDISGVIALTGKAVGMVVLSMSRQVALKAASAMLMVEATEINDDVSDAVGELTNMIAGAAKAELDEFELSISLPTVITGAGHEVRFPQQIVAVCIEFDTEWGPLTLECGLVPVEEPVAC